MGKTLKTTVKIVSVIITLLVLAKFISLLDFVSFDFGAVGRIGWYIPGWILGFAGGVLSFVICKEMCDTRFERIFFRISAFFCIFVALFDLFILYIISRI